MTGRAQAVWLPDGQRLHLHHGPIDMIVAIEGPGRRAAFERAVARFSTLLDELVAELPRLRSARGTPPRGETAQLMHKAVRPFADRFVTPMAAVAGAGADTILAATVGGAGIDKAYVNNGGDTAFHLRPGRSIEAAVATDPPARVLIAHHDPVRGIASSGWQGRSHSLGIADNVTVLARTAARADAAATLIANAVDLPGHPAIIRTPATDSAPDSDLGRRRVTTHVGPLSPAEISYALARGSAYAHHLESLGLVSGAALMLQGQCRFAGHLPLIRTKDTANA